MQDKTAEYIVDTVNAAGYRTGSKRFGDRLFTIDTINAITRNEFYAEYEPGCGYGTVLYKGQRFIGELLQALKLPPYWREMVRERILEAAKKTGLDMERRNGRRNGYALSVDAF